MNADIETAKRVYAYVRQYRDTHLQHRFAPHPSGACQALGLTYREYIRALCRLVELQFLTRSSYDKRWIAVSIKVRTCACGAEIMPENAIFIASRGRIYVSGSCRSCRRLQWAAASHRHRQSINNAAYLKVWRLNRALKQKGASA